MYRYILGIFVFVISYASGAVLSPLVEEVCDGEITSSNSIKTFSAANGSDDIVGIEVILQRVLKRENGKELRIDVEQDEIDWYPKQFILKPKSSKNFRVQLNMAKMPKVEHSYRVIVKEHPLNFKKETKDEESNTIKPNIKMVFNYEGFLFVRKCSYKDDLKVQNINFLKNEKQLELEIKNFGKKSVVPSMRNLNFIVKTASKEYTLKGKILETKRVFPDSENTFLIDIKEDKSVLDLDQNDIIGVEIIKKD